MKNKIFQSRDLCLRALDTNSSCTRNVCRMGIKMMMDKRLINIVPESKKYIAGNVLLQWISLLANMTLMFELAHFIEKLMEQDAGKRDFIQMALIAAVAVLIRYFCQLQANRMSYLSSRSVKLKLRELIYGKLLRLGSAYKEKVQTSEVVQVAVEGVDQLETYFGAYLPQFFYAMLAPLTLFIALCFVSVPAAVVLLICVPLIPVSIAAVQTWAKKLLAKYWGQYTALGDTFLENLQGLTTLKIFQTDEIRHQKMNEEAEKFRKITMKVLTMQLNSVTIMDLIAYGGAALGVILSATQYRAGRIEFGGALVIILLAADFFLPMRQLGSFFHIAMNGMAASDKIFRLLELEEPKQPEEKQAGCEEVLPLCLKNVGFNYEADREILKDVSLTLEKGTEKSHFYAIVGESGSGKSTLAGILMGRNTGYQGEITLGGRNFLSWDEETLFQTITYVGHQSYLFKGTVAENLRIGKPEASEAELWAVLEQVKLAAFFREEKGLKTALTEGAGNLSGGQRQRLSLARALLHDSPMYIFDEATSNIDVESETDIMEQISLLARKKTVLLISHRLVNVIRAEKIFVLEKGRLIQEGSHQELKEKDGVYRRLWEAQQSLENYGREEVAQA